MVFLYLHPISPAPANGGLSLSSKFTDWLDWLPPCSRDLLAQSYRLSNTLCCLHGSWRVKLLPSGLHSRHFICQATSPATRYLSLFNKEKRNIFSVDSIATAPMQQQVPQPNLQSISHAYFPVPVTQLTLIQTDTTLLGSERLLTDMPTEKFSLSPNPKQANASFPLPTRLQSQPMKTWTKH